MRAWILAAAWAAAVGAHAQDAPAPAAPSVEVGRRAYTSTCARCHGIGLVVTSSAYYDLRGFPKDEKLRFFDSVANGKRQMPAWRDVLKPATIESIWLYIGSVNGW